MAKKKEDKTNAMRILDQHGISYTARLYTEDESPMDSRDYGVHIAQKLGLEPERCFKTLVARGASGGLYVYEAPVAESLDLKKAAQAVGEKSVALLPVKEILSVTGYVRGGCSPVGMKKRYPVVFHETALRYDTICISAGRIGAQMEVAPAALMALLDAASADITTGAG